MAVQITSAINTWVAESSDIAGSNPILDGSSEAQYSITPALLTAFYNAIPPTLADGEAGALRLDSNCRLVTTVDGPLSLPTGAATDANQTAGNAHLNKLTPNVTGAANATNGAAMVTISAPGAGQAIVLQSIHFGFSANPATAALLTVTISGLSTITVPVTAGGAGFLPMPLEAPANTAVSVSLAAGGSGVVGYCNIIYKVVAL